MYKELDDLLLEETSIDLWYDDGFLIAQSIMNDFSENDWINLSQIVLERSLEWQKKLVYCLDNQIIQEEIEIIEKLLSVNDDELLEMCIDTLRSFDNELGHEYVKNHPEVIVKVKEKFDGAGNVTKMMLKSFMKIFEMD